MAVDTVSLVNTEEMLSPSMWRKIPTSGRTISTKKAAIRTVGTTHSRERGALTLLDIVRPSHIG
jgi:hypothetical protein